MYFSFLSWDREVMVHYKDFVREEFDMEGRPALAKFRQKLEGSSRETMEDMIDRLNGWVLGAEVDVINIETIVLPHKVVGSLGGEKVLNHCAVRVWYRSLPAEAGLG